MADVSPLAALAGGIAALILCSRRRIAPRWALAGSVAACAARLALPVVDPLIAPATIPWVPRSSPELAGLGRALPVAWVGLGGALLARAAPRAEGGEPAGPALLAGLPARLRRGGRPGHRAGAHRGPGRARNARGHRGVRHGRSRPAVRRERHPRRAAPAALRAHRDLADPRRERPRPLRPGGRGRRHLPHGVRGALRALRRRSFARRHRSCGRRRRGDGVRRARPRARGRRDRLAGPDWIRDRCHRCGARDLGLAGSFPSAAKAWRKRPRPWGAPRSCALARGSPRAAPCSPRDAPRRAWPRRRAPASSRPSSP